MGFINVLIKSFDLVFYVGPYTLNKKIKLLLKNINAVDVESRHLQLGH